jgi:hypothetical protein
MINIYTGIGSRGTPKSILKLMVSIGKLLGKNDFILRSGGADGADSAFERGCDLVKGKKEIYLPEKNFNNNPSTLYKVSGKALDLACEFHPAWFNLSDYGQRLHGRNCYQVLGLDLKTPTDFIVCWTPKSGGTTQALRIATRYKIRIFNFFFEDHVEKLREFLENSYELEWRVK